jgi:site-specific DNA-methyltransferase (adenine-specific)
VADDRNGKASPGAPGEADLPAPVLETGLGRLYHLDCLELLRSLPEATVDLFFADPPFNLDKQYGREVRDDRPEEEYLGWCRDWLAEAVRLLREGGSLFLYNLPRWNLPLGAWLSGRLTFRHWIAVDIKYSLPIAGRLYPAHYALLYFTKGKRPAAFDPPRLPIPVCRHCGGEIPDYGGYKSRMNPKGVNLTDVWGDLSPVRHRKTKRRGANELPLKMLHRVVRTASREGDLVLDPFVGSGTTCVAAELMGRRWIGGEIADPAPILARFGRLAEERELLDAIEEGTDRLFTPETLRRRERHGHDSSRYRLE